MTVQEIYATRAIKEIELEILTIYFDNERRGTHDEKEVFAVRKLLGIRKKILNSFFVLDENYKMLLAEFNDAMTKQLIEMRKQTIDVFCKIKETTPSGYFMAEGKCFLGYEYPKIHPVQSMRAKKMWAILNGTLDEYQFLYSNDGVYKFDISNENPDVESECSMLYLNEEDDNWNEGLDREMTKDMHLTYAFHNLFDHTEFSIFDLLWVRDFNIEVHTKIDTHTYPTEDWGDDLDWSKCDYFD